MGLGKSVFISMAACLAAGSCSGKGSVTFPSLPGAEGVNACITKALQYDGKVDYGTPRKDADGIDRPGVFGLTLTAPDGTIDADGMLYARNGGVMLFPSDMSDRLEKIVMQRTGATDTYEARKALFLDIFMKGCMPKPEGQSGPTG